jgi:hypothetical protein
MASATLPTALGMLSLSASPGFQPIGGPDMTSFSMQAFDSILTLRLYFPSEVN